MTQRILAIGECMVEMSGQDCGHYALNFAGDTFNTAWYLRQLLPAAFEVEYLSAVGDDPLSKQMHQFIAASGIVPHLAIVPDRSVGLYLISTQQGERSFQYWRSASAARCLAQYLKPMAELKKGDLAYFSGITLAILSVSDRAHLLASLARARRAGVSIAYDSNLRPQLWESPDEMCQWITAGSAVADIVLPSFEDEANFFADQTLQATVSRYHAAGARTIVVKNGENPMRYQQGESSNESYTPTVNPTPIDTTAAGDSFNAGFLAAIMRGQSMQAAVAAGSAVAYKVVSSKGALVDLALDES